MIPSWMRMKKKKVLTDEQRAILKALADKNKYNNEVVK